MSDVVGRARVWVRDVHRGSAAEIIPDLLDEVDRLQQDCTIQRARAEKAEAERDELAATVERVQDREVAARTLRELYAELVRWEGYDTRDVGGGIPGGVGAGAH